MAVSFERAPLQVEKPETFQQLKEAIERAVAVGRTEKFLKRMQSAGVRIRNFDQMLQKGILDDGRERRSQQLYGELPVPDQAQIREFYLSQIEEIAPELRHKFSKLYQYY